MSEPDLSPVKPYAGFEAAMAAEAEAAQPGPTSFMPVPEILPANPATWKVTVPLEHPLLIDGVPLDAITIRRATGADVSELMEEDPREATLPARLRARICGVHPAVFGALAADDAERVAEASGPFLPRVVRAIEAALEAAEAGD